MKRNGMLNTGIVAILLVAMFASATPVQAATELKATYENTNALSYLTYQQPYSSLAWSAYYPKAGSFNGYLLKWEYGKNLDMNHRRSLSVSSFPIGSLFPVTIAGTNVADLGENFYGQCASFVKSVAKSTVVTGDWNKGRNVLSSYKTQPVARGVAIAKFNSDGSYDCCGRSHVAIFDRYYYENGVLKGIVAWDQNFVRGCGLNDCGLVGYHVIKTTNAGTTSDAAAYSVVTI